MTSKAYTFEKRFVCMPGVQRTGNNKILQIPFYPSPGLIIQSDKSA